MEKVLKTGKNFCFTWKVDGLPEPSTVLPEDAEYIYQKESGCTNTNYVHYQGYVRFSKNVTPVALKKICPQVHWENRLGTHKQAVMYCTKTETQLELPINHNISLTLPVGQRNDLSGAREKVLSHGNYRDCVNDPDLDPIRAKYPNWIKETLAAHVLENTEFIPRPWQQDLLDVLSVPCTDDRTVTWYVDEEGRSGKTVFGKFLVTNHSALYLTNGKTADAACIYDSHPIVLFNYTRSQSERINYEVLEMLKDGILMSGKYVPVQKVTKSPHVVVFANFRPNEEMLSKDRWNIIDMADLKVNSLKRTRLNLEEKPRKVFIGSYVDGFTPK